MHAPTVSGSSYVTKPCCVQKPWLLDVLYPLWPLHSFYLLFSRVSWDLMGEIWWRHPVRAECFKVSHCLRVVWLLVSVLLPIFCRSKPLWWWWSKAGSQELTSHLKILYQIHLHIFGAECLILPIISNRSCCFRNFKMHSSISKSGRKIFLTKRNKYVYRVFKEWSNHHRKNTQWFQYGMWKVNYADIYLCIFIHLLRYIVMYQNINWVLVFEVTQISS